MYDAGKIVPAVLIGLALLTVPAWYSVANGQAVNRPQPVVANPDKQCVEPVEYMKANHMTLLVDNWRETVVRTGVRTYVASDGKEWNISLEGTCLDCHSNKAEFCDRCHTQVGAEPNCWNCHNEPGGSK